MKTRPAPSTLTEDQLAAFERDGFLAIDNVVPPEDLAVSYTHLTLPTSG